MKYTALTIGPIYPTFEKARKTRELWGTSFLFSMLTKKIIEQITDKGNIILPYAEHFPELETVGLYPDRILYRGEIDFKEIVAKAIEGMAGLIQTKPENKLSVTKFLEQYLRVYYFTGEINTSDPDRNYVEQLNLVLDSLELNDKVAQNSKFWSIEEFCKYLPQTDLYKDHFKKKNGNRSRSLVEIATEGLSGIKGYQALVEKYIVEKSDLSAPEDGTLVLDEKDSEFIDALRTETESFKSYHKYVAVVYADGDKMGKFIKEVVKLEGQGVSVHQVSDQLFEWAKRSAELIEGFGGLPVYAGGDDLLFFAPVVNKEKNLFATLKDINETFIRCLRPLLEGKVDEKFTFPSLSFGVSISYYKYPLNEALATAHDLLVDMKRKFLGNGICMKILKHSGSDYEYALKFDNSDGLLQIFNKLMVSEMDKTMLSSTAYHLQNGLKVFDELNGDEQRIRQFFINNMEGFPKEEEINEQVNHYLLEVERLVNLAYKDKPMVDTDGKYINRMLPVYDMLRIVKFFKGMDEIH